MQEFIRYQQMLSSLALPALDAAMQSGVMGDSAQTGSVVWGAAAARLLLDDDPSLHPDLANGLRQIGRMSAASRGSDGSSQEASLSGVPVLMDTGGHRRAVYLPFVLHLHLAAFGRRYETLAVSSWGDCQEAIPEALWTVRDAENYSEGPPPARLVDVVLWQALCIFEQALLLKRDVDAEWVDAVVHQVVANGGEGGSLHPRSDDDSLDAWTYRELCGLHALANLALMGRNEGWSRRVQQIATFHLDHTQPDHTTNQPWGLFAFVWSDKTRSFAEQQIHDVTSHGSSGRGAIPPLSAMLLADAANAVAEFSAG